VDTYRDHEPALEKAATSGVPPQYILGIVGVETFFGENTGRNRVLDALATLAFDYPPRAPFFRGELEQFLLMTREESLDPLAPLGSYAGAMGIPQFMPSSFRKFAVDGDGDGRRDLWADWPDVFSSVGNYLKQHGWRPGEPVMAAADVAGADLAGLDLSKPALTETVASLRRRGLKFDTALPDLNMVQLFRTNRYVGPDRIGDANQLSLGLTSRLLDAAGSRQYLSATIGQAFYFEDPRVQLPGEPVPDRGSSDIIAELELAAFKNWNAHLGYQWNPDQSLTERSEVNLQYRPASDRVVNAGYRFRRDLFEQFDVSAAWPISRRWRGYARWVYSLDEEKTLDQFVGLEYSSCCWALRMVTRRFVSNRTGDIDTSVGLQLELKGLSSVGTDSEAFLRDAIRGYSALPPESQH
jgi:hypothetical protein